MFLTSFSKKKSVSTKSMTEKNHDFWMNELQLLTLKDGRESVAIRGRDIECSWCDNHECKLGQECDFMIRTRSGGEFSLEYKSWLKVRYEDPNIKL